MSLIGRHKRKLACVVADVPARLDLALVTRVANPPDGDEWTHEVKFDGYRIVVRIDTRGGVRLITRHGNDWTSRAPGVVESLRMLQLRDTVLDGEATLFYESGAPNFYGLRGRGHASQVAYVAFDAMFLSGRDLRGASLVERQVELASAVPESARSAWLCVSQPFEASGAAVFTAACKLGVEGIISKRRTKPYPRGRTRDWVKTLNPGYRRV